MGKFLITNNSQQLPLYKKICELLHREITAGHWLPGERLPVESKLAQDLGVAIGTLRKALAQLESEGLLERRQGSGTYVKRAPSGSAVYQFFHLELPNGGGAPTAQTLSVEQVILEPVASQLGLRYLKTKLWQIRRVRFLNETPVAVEEIWIDHRHSHLLEAKHLHESLYMHYRENFDFWIDRVEDKVDCAVAPQWATQQLGLTENTVLARVERKGWSNKNQLEEFSRTWFMPQKCRYIARWS
ncbi:MAG: hypothetical protein OFPI_31460 [Osedax symbiont Rs2]|nr:MAG: hypothetical protein OFPI_31460 [Osedax symbiont Rs2]